MSSPGGRGGWLVFQRLEAFFRYPVRQGTELMMTFGMELSAHSRGRLAGAVCRALVFGC